MKLRHDRPAWVDRRRRQLQREAEHRATDDGMGCGIIPFGAIYQWARTEEKRLAEALAQPLPARITGWDASGIGLVVTCPYCQQEHRHIVTDEWQPHEPLEALCSKGQYWVTITARS